jgi:hypothetical protein
LLHTSHIPQSSIPQFPVIGLQSPQPQSLGVHWSVVELHGEHFGQDSHVPVNGLQKPQSPQSFGTHFPFLHSEHTSQGSDRPVKGLHFVQDANFLGMHKFVSVSHVEHLSQGTHAFVFESQISQSEHMFSHLPVLPLHS